MEVQFDVVLSGYWCCVACSHRGEKKRIEELWTQNTVISENIGTFTCVLHGAVFDLFSAN